MIEKVKAVGDGERGEKEVDRFCVVVNTTVNTAVNTFQVT